MTPATISNIAQLVLQDPPRSKPELEVLRGVLTAFDRVPVQVVSVKEAARLLGVTPAGLRGFVRRGLIAPRKDDPARSPRGFLLADVQRLAETR